MPSVDIDALFQLLHEIQHGFEIRAGPCDDDDEPPAAAVGLLADRDRA